MSEGCRENRDFESHLLEHRLCNGVGARLIGRIRYLRVTRRHRGVRVPKL